MIKTQAPAGQAPQRSSSGVGLSFLLLLLFLAGALTAPANRSLFHNLLFLSVGILLSGGMAIVFGHFLYRHSHTEEQNDQLQQLNRHLRQVIHDLRRFKIAVEESTDAIIMTTGDTRILYANPAWEALTGYSLDEVRGKKANILKTEKTPGDVHRTLGQALHDGISFYSDAFVNRRKDGSEYFAMLSIYPVYDDEEEVLFWVGVQTDITERKKVKRLQSDFVSLASHQLRTPLSAVRLTLGTLLRKLKGPLTSEQEEFITGAQEYAMRMAETIRTLLSVSLVEEGKAELDCEDVAISAMLEKVRTSHAAECVQKGQTFSLQCPENLTCRTDPGTLTEIIDILISNAIQYTPAGGSIDITAQAQEDGIRIAVRDTGIGIAKREQGKLFSKFFRTEKALRHRPDGLGLGLYLAHTFATLLGGSLSIESTEDKGSIFALRLPSVPHSSV